jgi:hypothetical protein
MREIGYCAIYGQMESHALKPALARAPFVFLGLRHLKSRRNPTIWKDRVMPQQHSNPASAKNEQVRSLGRQIEQLEDQRDAAEERGEDTTAMDQQIDQLEQQLQQAKQTRKDTEAQARADRKAARNQDNPGQGQGRQNQGGNSNR